ncbi:hypothetical protein STENM327S_04929 [Streptomyces tendae]
MTTSSNGRVIRVLIADDQQMVRQGFTGAAQHPCRTSRWPARRSTAGRRWRRSAELAPGRRPDGHPHARAERHRGDPARSWRRTDLKVLVLTTFDLDEYVYQALRAGASGFLLKDASAGQLADGGPGGGRRRGPRAPAVTRRLITEFSKLADAPRPARPRRPRRPDRTRDGGPDRAGPVQLGDRRAPGGRRVDDQDPCQSDPGEAGPARPHPGGGLRLRGPPGDPGLGPRAGPGARNPAFGTPSAGPGPFRGRPSFPIVRP